MHPLLQTPGCYKGCVPVESKSAGSEQLMQELVVSWQKDWIVRYIDKCNHSGCCGGGAGLNEAVLGCAGPVINVHVNCLVDLRLKETPSNNVVCIGPSNASSLPLHLS